MRRRLAQRLCLLAVAAAIAGPAQASSSLQPYQMVRSLQLVQDRVANGDHAALPMQRKLLEMIDVRMRESVPDEFAESRNFRALLIYMMSGGNPSTVEGVVSRLILDERDSRLSAGLLRYVRGDRGRAASILQDIEPRDVSPEISPLLALVRGTLGAEDDPEKALAMLDFARLVGPGTLIEEAALRRTISLSAETGAASRFMAASGQYIRRFLTSPYASQFADAFVGGVIQLNAGLELTALADLIGEMNSEQSRVIYLRIARRAAIERKLELIDFATSGLDIPADEMAANDPRTGLYFVLARIATEDGRVLLDSLDAIDATKLSASDRGLYDAARSIVEAVYTLPGSASRSAEAAIAAEPVTLSPDQPEKPELAETADFVSSTRERLEEIDELLQEPTQ